jgi:hypothetical protein
VAALPFCLKHSHIIIMITSMTTILHTGKYDHLSPTIKHRHRHISTLFC